MSIKRRESFPSGVESLPAYLPTVGRYGHDYVKQTCQDMAYTVVPDIESLPSRITTLYRRLTE